MSARMIRGGGLWSACLCAAALLGACASSRRAAPPVPETTAVIRFVNATPWTVHLMRGSGRVEAAVIAPFGAETVTNVRGAVEETYYPVFDVGITPDFALRHLRPLDVDFYYQSDGAVGEQEIRITPPSAFSGTAAYLALANNADSGGIFVSRDDSTSRMISLSGGRANVNPGETAVFALPDGAAALSVGPGGVRREGGFDRPGWVYTLAFDGAALVLVDARPLTAVGERSWRFVLGDAESPPLLVIHEGVVLAAAAAPDGLTLTRLSLSGEASGGSANSAVTIHGAAAAAYTAFRTDAAGGLLVTGYNYDAAPAFTPLIRRLTPSGGLMWEYPGSDRAGSRFAYFTAAADDGGGAWIAAGAADSMGAFPENYRAYVRAFQDRDGIAFPLWERGGGDFPADYGAVEAAAWDAARGRWLVSGGVVPERTIFGGAESAAYLCALTPGGAVVPAGIFTNYAFHALAVGRDGAVYLAGEERKPNGEVYAALLKRGPDGAPLWRDPPVIAAPQSYFQTLLLDEANEQVVVAGVTNARDETGAGGTPFIAAFDSDTGVEKWRGSLGAVSDRANVVTGLVKTPGYGYALSLCAAAEDGPAAPFIIVRVNEFGRFDHE